MKIQILKAGLVLGALIALPAFASGDDARIDSSTRVSNDIAVSGKVKVKGTIQVRSESAATVDQDQVTAGNYSGGDGDHDAHMGENALAGAQGNIGVNVAAGVGNTQANNAALSAVDGKKVFASAMTFNSQGTLMNVAEGAYEVDGYHSATLDGDALAGAKGNIGVNVGAGVGNAAGHFFVGNNLKLFACLGHAFKTLHFHRHGRTGRLDFLALVVKHGPNAA